MTNTAGEPSTDDPLEHALALARCKLRVLPIRPGGKHPPMNSWQHAATTDEKTIRNWWGGLYRGYGVGIAMGLQPDGRRVFAVDVDEHDPANSGSEALHELEQIHGVLPETVLSLTGSGGSHLLFDSGGVEVTNGVICPGIDIRGQGGQIVVAPSSHPNGKPYGWEESPMATPIAKAPEWLLELVKPQPATDTPAPSTESFNNHLNTPADVLRASWDWPSELARRGWQHVRSTANGDTHWTRPGKDPREGTSGTLHPDGPFVVFTTDASVSDMWKAGKVGRGCVSLSPLAFVAAYDHGGDLGATARALNEGFTPDVLTSDGQIKPPADDGLPVPIDWDALFARENDVEWLIEDIWPLGRQIHIFAARKTGKSLVMLWFAANIAAGRDPLTGNPRPRVRVAYLDYEMSEADLLERVEEMGFVPDDLRGWLLYYLWPVLPPLDTDAGGVTLVRMIERDQVAAIVLDTVSRVVQGEENSADTFRAFYTFTGMRLKRQGISLARLDHEGHEGGRSRGSSAKSDDVDIISRLVTTDDGLTIVKKNARMSWIPELVELKRTEPLGFVRTNGSWPAGVKEKAAELDALGASPTISKRAAVALLKANGHTPGRGEIIIKAIQFRKDPMGTTLGTALVFDSGTTVGTTETNGDLAGGTTSGTTGNHPPPAMGVGGSLPRGNHPQPTVEAEDWGP